LVASGKPAHEFIFAGFLPNRTIARRNKLTQLAQLGLTIIFYESCHRIIAALEDVQKVFPGKDVVVARELTKKFEERLEAKASELLTHFSTHKPLGEFVILIPTVSQ